MRNRLNYNIVIHNECVLRFLSPQLSNYSSTNDQLRKFIVKCVSSGMPYTATYIAREYERQTGVGISRQRVAELLEKLEAACKQ